MGSPQVTGAEEQAEALLARARELAPGKVTAEHRTATLKVTPGTLTEQAVAFNVQAGDDVMLWEMPREQAIRHAAKVLHLAGITEMHIGPNGEVTCE